MSEVTADVRTRMEGGVEQLEAIVFGLDRVEKALEANEPLGKSLQAIRQLEASTTDVAQRASKFPELKPLLATLAQSRAQLDERLVSLFRELRLESPSTFEQRLAAAEPHLPLIYRGTLESSGLAWAAAVACALLGAMMAVSTAPALAAFPVAAGIGALLWDRAVARAIIVSQQQLVVGSRSVPLKSIREIIVPRVGGAYRCRLTVADAPMLEVPAIMPLLDALRGTGVAVRYE